MINTVETIKCSECYGQGYIFYGDSDNFGVEPCECVSDEILI
jgi:hypothetical protein